MSGVLPTSSCTTQKVWPSVRMRLWKISPVVSGVGFRRRPDITLSSARVRLSLSVVFHGSFSVDEAAAPRKGLTSLGSQNL